MSVNIYCLMLSLAMIRKISNAKRGLLVPRWFLVLPHSHAKTCKHKYKKKGVEIVQSLKLTIFTILFIYLLVI